MDSKTLYFFHYSFMPTVDIQEILIFLACWRKTSNPMLCTPTLSLFGFIFNLCISERGLDWAVYKTDCSLLNKKQISHKRFSPKLPCQLLRLSIILLPTTHCFRRSCSYQGPHNHYHIWEQTSVTSVCYCPSPRAL